MSRMRRARSCRSYRRDHCYSLVGVSSCHRSCVLLIHRCIDEILPLYVVFRTPFIEEDTLKAYLARLAISLEAFVFGTAPPPEPGAKPPPPKEVVFSETIKDSNEPLIVRHKHDGGSHVYVFWKVEVFVGKEALWPSEFTSLLR